MPDQKGGKFPFLQGPIDYLKEASRVRDLNTRPRVRYFRYDERKTSIDPMTQEVINQQPQFLSVIEIPAKILVKTPGGSFVTPDGPFRKENVLKFVAGTQTLREAQIRPRPLDEFELLEAAQILTEAVNSTDPERDRPGALRFRLKAFDKSQFLQNNQASLDEEYTCEFVERGSFNTDAKNRDLPTEPSVEVATNV